MENRHLEDIGSITDLAYTLDDCSRVKKFDSNGEKEAWTLTHGLSDIEATALKLIQESIPTLTRTARTEEEILDALHEIGEDLRHIIYHIKDLKFYSYLT